MPCNPPSRPAPPGARSGRVGRERATRQTTGRGFEAKRNEIQCSFHKSRHFNLLSPTSVNQLQGDSAAFRWAEARSRHGEDTTFRTGPLSDAGTHASFSVADFVISQARPDEQLLPIASTGREFGEVREREGSRGVTKKIDRSSGEKRSCTFAATGPANSKPRIRWSGKKMSVFQKRPARP